MVVFEVVLNYLHKLLNITRQLKNTWHLTNLAVNPLYNAKKKRKVFFISTYQSVCSNDFASKLVPVLHFQLILQRALNKRLARALLDLSGLSVTNSQAAEIMKLYSELLDFNKRPLTFPLKKYKPTRGRFGGTKQYRAGHVGVEAVKRYMCEYILYVI